MKSLIVQLLTPAWIALRTYWLAIVGIQFCALAAVVLYFRVEDARAGFAVVADWQVRGGLWFAALCTVFSGGIFPECLKRLLRPAGVVGPRPKELAHQFVMWAFVGLLVNRFYWLQGVFFGHGNDALTLLCKVLFDQLVFAPLICLPFIVSWFLLYEKNYDLRQWWVGMRPRALARRVLPLWMTALSFWPVLLLMIYALPHNLQFPLFLFGNAAFSILMIFIVRRQSQPKPPALAGIGDS